MKAAFVSVVPSPYQRDLFAALAERCDLRVYYMENSAPDSPWPAEPLREYERVLPGFWVGAGPVRSHVNRLPTDLGDRDVVVMNTIVSLTAQRLIRGQLRGRRWMFWGERLRKQAGAPRAMLQRALTGPLADAAGIAAIGSLAMEDYRSRFPRARLFNIPYHTDLRPFGECGANPGRNEYFTFLFCGQMIARKGVDLLLRAFEVVVRECPQVRLLLVGREAELPALLPALAPATRERIEFTGFQAPARLPEFFGQADAFILPSRHDGWGVVVNQALGAGLPLLCSDAVGAAHDLIRPDVNGMIFPAGDEDAMARAMFRVVRDPSLASRWGEASRAAAPEWTPQAGAAKWIEALEEVGAA